MASTYNRGDNDTRPWGTWEVLESENNFCVKRKDLEKINFDIFSGNDAFIANDAFVM